MRRGVYFDGWYPHQHNYHPSLPARRLRMVDEVADMPISTQARILRVLTDQSFVRVGGNRQIGVDVRVVSSTARDLEKEIEEKRFREDLFYRLNVVPVAIPSLADRRDDIPALSDHFFTRYAREQGAEAPEVSSEAMAALHLDGVAQ